MNRSITSIANTPFKIYDLEGPAQAETIAWLPISYRRDAGVGSYFMRMRPGAETQLHDHPGFEEFLVLEGELIDSDGAVFRAGDFVSFAPGTRHSSRTETGCLLAVFEWRDHG